MSRFWILDFGLGVELSLSSLFAADDADSFLVLFRVIRVIRGSDLFV